MPFPLGKMEEFSQILKENQSLIKFHMVIHLFFFKHSLFGLIQGHRGFFKGFYVPQAPTVAALPIGLRSCQILVSHAGWLFPSILKAYLYFLDRRTSNYCKASNFRMWTRSCTSNFAENAFQCYFFVLFASCLLINWSSRAGKRRRMFWCTTGIFSSQFDLRRNWGLGIFHFPFWAK